MADLETAKDLGTKLLEGPRYQLVTVAFLVVCLAAIGALAWIALELVDTIRAFAELPQTG